MKKIYIVLLLGLLVVSFATPNVYIQYQIDNATLDISSITVLSAKKSSLICRVNFTFDNPSLAARTFPTTLNIFSNGRYFASTDVPTLDIEKGSNEFSITSEVRIIDKRYAGELVKEIITKKVLTWRFKGQIAVGLGGSSVPLSVNNIDKELQIECMAGLNFSLNSLLLQNFTNNSFSLSAKVEIFNPSSISLHLNNITLQTKIGNEVIGNANVDGQKIDLGKSFLEANIECKPEGNAEYALADTLERILAGDNVTLTLSGAAGYSTLLDAYLIERFEQKVVLPGIKGLNISIEDIEVVKSTNGSIILVAKMKIDNPSNITGEMGRVTLEMLYDNKVVAKLVHDSLKVRAGRYTSYEKLTLIPIRNDILGKIVSQTLDGNEVNIYVRGDNSSKEIASRILSKTLQKVPFRSGMPFSLSIEKMYIKECTLQKIDFSISAFIYNEMPLSGNITGAELDIYYKNNKVGSLSLEPFALVRGKNLVLGNCTIAPNEPKTAREILEAYLSGRSVTVQVKGRQNNEPDAMKSALSYIHTNVTLEGAKESIKIEGEKVVLINFTGNDLLLGVGISLHNPTFVCGYVGNISLKLYYEGKNIDENEEFVGYIKVPSIYLNPGENKIYQEVLFRAQSESSLFSLGSAVLDGLGFGLDVNLTLTGDENDDSILSKLLSTYRTKVTLSQSGKLGIEIEKANIHETSEGMLSMTLYAKVINPTIMEGSLDCIAYDVSYDGYFLGRMYSRGMYLLPGENTLVTQTYLAPANEESAAQLVANYLSGNDVFVDVKAYLDSPFGFGLAYQTVKLTGYSGLCVEILEARLIDSKDGEIDIFAKMDIFNPAPLSGDMGEISIDAYCNGSFVCTITVPNLYLNQGWNRVESYAKVSPLDENIAFEMVSKLLSGHSITLQLSGDSDSLSLMSRLISHTYSNTTLNPSGKVTISPYSIKFLNSTPENITMETEFEIYNPTPLSTDMVCLQGCAYYGGKYLGLVSSTEISVKCGFSHATCVVKVSEPDTELGSKIMGDYLNGNDVEFQIVGSMSKKGDGNAPALFSVNLTIKGTGSLNITLGEVTLTKAEEELLHMKINLTIKNPTMITGMMGRITFNVKFNNSLVGNLTTEELELRNGIYDISLNCTLFPNEIQAMTRILNKVFAGENVTIVINGARISGEILSGFLADYACNLTIISYGPLGIKIDKISISGGTSNALLLSIILTVTNPTTLEADLPLLYFDIYESGLEVGELTISPTYIHKGDNQLTVPAALDGSNEHISSILSRHVNGTDVYLTIRGSNSNANSVLAQALVGFEQSAVIEGVTEPLITAVYIDDVDIHLNLGITAYVTVYIHNPTGFTFNVTYLSSDLYFDDNDESSMLFWSYPPQNNIYLGTVVKSLSPPMFLTGYQNETISASLDVHSIELEVRLYDEYYNDNEFYVDAIGYIIIKVGAFSVPVYFAQYDIFVPNSS